MQPIVDGPENRRSGAGSQRDSEETDQKGEDSNGTEWVEKGIVKTLSVHSSFVNQVVSVELGPDNSDHR
jgi:hypothetical protein